MYHEVIEIFEDNINFNSEKFVSIDYEDDIFEMNEKYEKLMRVIYSNLSKVYFKIGDYYKVIKMSTKIIDFTQALSLSSSLIILKSLLMRCNIGLCE